MNRRNFLKRSAAVVPAGVAVAAGVSNPAAATTVPTGAVAEILEKLTAGTGYYHWFPASDDGTLLARIPRKLEGEEWLDDEGHEVLHLCDPEKYLNAVKARDLEASSKYVGYIRKAKCTKCGFEV